MMFQIAVMFQTRDGLSSIGSVSNDRLYILPPVWSRPCRPKINSTLRETPIADPGDIGYEKRTYTFLGKYTEHGLAIFEEQ